MAKRFLVSAAVSAVLFGAGASFAAVDQTATNLAQQIEMLVAQYPNGGAGLTSAVRDAVTGSAATSTELASALSDVYAAIGTATPNAASALGTGLGSVPIKLAVEGDA